MKPLELDPIQIGIIKFRTHFDPEYPFSQRGPKILALLKDEREAFDRYVSANPRSMFHLRTGARVEAESYINERAEEYLSGIHPVWINNANKARWEDVSRTMGVDVLSDILAPDDPFYPILSKIRERHVPETQGAS